MTTLTITRGLPACGKTTFARAWVAEDPVHRARVNRDDIRAMCHAGTFIQRSDTTPGTERAVMALRDAAIAALLKSGIDVINDDTNLPLRVVRDMQRLATAAGASFAVHDMTDVGVDECLRRDAARAAAVGHDVITDMYQRFVRGQKHPLPISSANRTEEPAPVPYTPPHGKPTAILVDIDGTLAIHGDRSPYNESRVAEDTPNAAVVEAVRAFALAGHTIICMSGRTEGCRLATMAWLDNYLSVPYDALYMRASGDSRKDAVVKQELFDQFVRHAWQVVLVLDDRDQVVKMWRSLGLTCLQVAEGAF